MIERVVCNDSGNSIHDTGKRHTKRIRLSEKNITDEYIEESTNSLYCTAVIFKNEYFGRLSVNGCF